MACAREQSPVLQNISSTEEQDVMNMIQEFEKHGNVYRKGETDSKLLDTLFYNVTKQKEKCQESGTGQRMTVGCCPLSGSCDISPVYKNENLSFYNKEQQEKIKECVLSCRTEEELSESFSHPGMKRGKNTNCKMEWRGKTQVHTEVQWLYVDNGLTKGHRVKLLYSHYIMCAGNRHSINECAAECALMSQRNPDRFLLVCYSDVFCFTDEGRSLDYLTKGGIPALKMEENTMRLANPEVVKYLNNRQYAKKRNITTSMSNDGW